MTKKKPKRKYSQALLRALERLPNPIEDKRHGLLIYLENGPARSNQSRFEHIVKGSHHLNVRDIESIPEGIAKKTNLKKDRNNRKGTYNYYFPRKGPLQEYIKVSIQIDDDSPRVARVKTIYVTRSSK